MSKIKGGKEARTALKSYAKNNTLAVLLPREQATKNSKNSKVR